MKREDFVQIIKLRSKYQIDRRRGNYYISDKLRVSFNDEIFTIKDYSLELIKQQMIVDNIAIASDGNFWDVEHVDENKYTLTHGNITEVCSIKEMTSRIDVLINSMLNIKSKKRP